jgi:O-acetyl-ADP-ribose deacetylase (regulator of RNase III)
MLTYHRTSLLTSQAQTIVNTVNTVGVMGKGLAQELKRQHPLMFKAYKKICDERLLDIGQLWLWRGSGQWVLNFPTKKHWRNPSKLSYIEDGLKKFVDQFEEQGIREVAFPRLGCGNGGLDWDDVQPLMHRYLSKLPIRVYIHDFNVDIGFPEHKEYSPEYAKDSYHDFIQDIKNTIDLNGRIFRYYDNSGSFETFINECDDCRELILRGNSWEASIDEIELIELWALLNKGPVDQSRLMRSSQEHMIALFSMLSVIDYIRPIEVSKDGSAKRIAIEKIRTSFAVETVEG